MNILHLRASNFVGGPEKQILEHFRYIDKERYHLFLGIFGEKNCPSELAQEAKKHGIDCIELNSKLPFSPFLIFQLSNEIKRQNIDILCTHGYKPNIIGYWACKLVPCIHIAFSRGFTAENFKVKVYEWLDKIILRRVKNVIAVSDGHAKELIHFGMNGSKLTVIHNCIDVNGFRNTAQKKDSENFRKEFQIGNDNPVITSVGRLSVEKGHILLLKAAKMVIRKYPKAKFVIVGEGSAKKSLFKWARANLSPDNVVFTGFRNDIAAIMVVSTLIINPSLSEAFPNVVLEALAIQKPVVASDVGGVPELIIPGKTGLLYPCKSYQTLAEKILYCLDNPEKCEEMARAGYQLVKEHFTFEEQAKKLEALYEKTYQKYGDT